MSGECTGCSLVDCVAWGQPTTDLAMILAAVEGRTPVQVSTYPDEAPGFMLASRQDHRSIASWLDRGCTFRILVPPPSPSVPVEEPRTCR